MRYRGINDASKRQKEKQDFFCCGTFFILLMPFLLAYEIDLLLEKFFFLHRLKFTVLRCRNP